MAHTRFAPRLSKSKYTTGLQCHRLLWWQVHEPDAPELVRGVFDQAILDRGTRVGEAARAYVPGGILIDVPYTEPSRRVEETRSALAAGAEILYEACFFEDRIFVAVDILSQTRGHWTLTEVKSTTKVKPEHLPDAAVQTHVLRRAGLPVKRVELMHLDPECRFPDLSKLFYRADITAGVEELVSTVGAEAGRQLKMLAGPLPSVETGDHCYSPYECPLIDRCWSPAPEHHVSSLYNMRRRRANELVQAGFETIHDLPDDLALSKIADRQRLSVQAGKLVVETGLRSAVSALRGPVAYLDFETVGLAIPVWPGCCPYDAVPAQFSCEVESGVGSIQHHEWIAGGPADPREPLARALIEAVRGARTIAVYNAVFERRCIEHLRDNLPHRASDLDDVIERLVDVLPIVRNHVYHPGFAGSFSLKSVVPALVGGSGYGTLDVAEGGVASVELEKLMFDMSLSDAKRAELTASLLAYCAMDTRGLAELVKTLRVLA